MSLFSSTLFANPGIDMDNAPMINPAGLTNLEFLPPMAEGSASLLCLKYDSNLDEGTDALFNYMFAYYYSQSPHFFVYSMTYGIPPIAFWVVAVIVSFFAWKAIDNY